MSARTVKSQTGGGLAPGRGPAAPGLEPLAPDAPPAGNGPRAAARRHRLGPEAASSPPRGRGARATAPGHGRSRPPSPRADLLGLHPGGAHRRLGHGPERGAVGGRGLDGPLRSAGEQAGGRERGHDHAPVPATLADGHVRSGPSGAPGLHRVSPAPYRRHGAPWGCGLRGLFAAALDVSAGRPGSNAGPHPHDGGRLSATRARAAATAVGVRPRPGVPRRHG
jgi:hypothetical protein